MPSKTDTYIINSLKIFNKGWRAKWIVYLSVATMIFFIAFFAMVLFWHNLTSV